MADPAAFTLRQLLPAETEGMAAMMRDELRRDAETAHLKLAWDILGAEAEKMIRNVLDCDLCEAIAGGWTKAQEIMAFADPAEQAEEKEEVLHLGEHKFVKELHPTVSVTIDPYSPLRLRFTLELAVHVRAIALTIRRGHILGWGGGDGRVSAQLLYGKTALHKARESSSLGLPGQVTFKPPGMRIHTLAA